jgi:Family of unknown function (DUF5681)
MTESTPVYRIGFGRPPIETQFRKGQSGNPSGRPKGARNFKTDLREELAEPVSVRVDGRSQTISSQRAAVKQLRATALRGGARALDRLLALAERYDLEDSADEVEQQLSVADQEILKRFTERVIREYEAEKSESGYEDIEEPSE